MTELNAPNSAVVQRLERLDGYLRADPGNNALLIDAFETALACGDWGRAGIYLAQGQALEAERLAWNLREADLWLAQQRYDEAVAVLEALGQTPHPPAGLREVLLHNLAFVDLRRGRFRECIARLAGSMELSSPPAPGGDEPPLTTTGALQQLWLRALHQEGELTRAIRWAQGAEREGRLDWRAAGVASLIAIDASEFGAAQRWCAVSLEGRAPREIPVESFVTQASLALAGQDAARATQFTEAALALSPGDGRAWSTRGFAALLAGELGPARAAFLRAVSAMPKHIGTWHGLGWAQILGGELPGARQSFETALALDRNFAESHGGLAVVLAMQEQRTDAEAHIALALKLDPQNVSGRYASALLEGGARSADDLQRLARRLLRGRAAPLGGDMGDIASLGVGNETPRE
ncbi:hypothetical protein [Variovorax ginsengisoli]|uniref:Tetratricopeptide repeat protein n=1 Tax=Variovorax ginsengisoli TaxID=363844 RepID=A0ABT8SEM4_9BURK|nr:hypothetical protein [Variovorax ginsengisoli]MDN8618025.1 hypothetical protein [Variovorax ginsengisoli]MDO1537195.1 hypothetical protein [Variovorax ginsengisoli]